MIECLGTTYLTSHPKLVFLFVFMFVWKSYVIMLEVCLRK